MGAKVRLNPGINDRYPEQIRILFTILSSVLKGHFCALYVNFQHSVIRQTHLDIDRH